MSDTVRTAPEPERSGVTVHEAAGILGISEVAVRARLRRGTLAGEKIGDVWRVYLSDDENIPRERFEPARPTGTYRDVPERNSVAEHGTHHGTHRDVPSDALVAQLLHEREHFQGEIDYLRTELAKRSQELAKERERADVLQREALGRIEALTATAGEGSGDPEPVETGDRDLADVGEDSNAPAGIWARFRRWWSGG